MPPKMPKIMGVVLLLLAVVGSARALETASATLTINGSEMSPGSVPDTGTITISFTNTVTNVTYTESVTYGQFSTASSVAAGFGAKFSADPITAVQRHHPRLCTLGVCAKSHGATITFQTRGPAAFGPITVTNTTTVGSFEPTATSWSSIGPALTLVSSSNPAIVGQSITLTSTTVGSSGVVPTGTITLLDGATILGGEPMALDASGSASISTSTLSAGLHHLTAEYSGDANYGVAVSARIQVINNTGPFIDYLVPNSGEIGERITIHGTGFGAIRGSVFFFNGIPAVIESWNDTKIAVRVPSSATTGVVTVVSGSSSPGKTFTLVVPSCPVFPN